MAIEPIHTDSWYGHQPLHHAIDLYLERLRSTIDRPIELHLHGSIALGAFTPATSDIDFVCLLDRSPSSDELKRIAAVHRELLRRTPLGRRFDGIYMPRDAAALASAPQRFPLVRNGRLRGTRRLEMAARRILARHPLKITGDVATPFEDPSDKAIADEMRSNLDVYWQRHERYPYRLLFTEMVDFAVTTIPRIVHTLETGEIVSKPRALELYAERLAPWRDLFDAARERMEGRGSRVPIGSPSRAMRVVRFIREVRKSIEGS